VTGGRAGAANIYKGQRGKRALDRRAALKLVVWPPAWPPWFSRSCFISWMLASVWPVLLSLAIAVLPTFTFAFAAC